MFGMKSTGNVKDEMGHQLQQARELFNEAGAATGEKAEELRKRGLTLLESATQKAQRLGTMAQQTGKSVVQSTDHLVHENPWKSMAISAGVGVVLGLLIGRQ